MAAPGSPIGPWVYLLDPWAYRAICRMDSHLMGVSILFTGLGRPTGLFLKKEEIHKTFKTFTR
jgi:hypothetical protein